MYKQLLIIGLISSTAATAQPLCNKAVERYIDLTDPYHYQSRSGTYCEGTISRKPVSGRSFQVVSVLKGPLRFSPTDQVITITAPGFPRTVNLEARTKSHTYRLDSQIVPSGSFVWQLGNVVKPKNFQPSQLFLIGYSGSVDNPLYVPLQPVTSSFQVSSVPVIVSLIADEELESVSWRYAPTTNGTRTKDFTAWIPANDGSSYTAGSRIDVRLNPKPALVAGEYIVDVTGQAVDSMGDRKRTESFRVWID